MTRQCNSETTNAVEKSLPLKVVVIDNPLEAPRMPFTAQNVQWQKMFRESNESWQASAIKVGALVCCLVLLEVFLIISQGR